MTQRVLNTTIEFSQPFQLKGMEEPLPAGTYKIETHEELIEGLSFPAYRRTETLLFLRPPPGQPSLIQIAVVDPIDLEEARQRDEAARESLKGST
ncbi:hypothetical protein N825_10785 [Skermanella stibiiresistens SB22]|uniref:Uncharacterized protein n=1 Tax=Skermanella stibiiresistens SB22 TaxID=1385369 RepID=W9H4K6_9PROT|nr:hypothetical protein [Skermanella stibiiresistens]EWY38678.1 hypothetical protein N825_10785 [Skermanella stibiiresistens SB22]